MWEINSNIGLSLSTPLTSSAVVMALSTGTGVHMFTLDPTFGEFVMTKVGVFRVIAAPRASHLLSSSTFSFLALFQRNLTLPKEPKKIFSCNSGNIDL